MIINKFNTQILNSLCPFACQKLVNSERASANGTRQNMCARYITATDINVVGLKPKRGGDFPNYSSLILLPVCESEFLAWRCLLSYNGRLNYYQVLKQLLKISLHLIARKREECRRWISDIKLSQTVKSSVTTQVGSLFVDFVADWYQRSYHKVKNRNYIIYNKPTRCNSGSIVFINNYRYALHFIFEFPLITSL